jgi:hypothetical protein
MFVIASHLQRTWYLLMCITLPAAITRPLHIGLRIVKPMVCGVETYFAKM